MSRALALVYLGLVLAASCSDAFESTAVVRLSHGALDPDAWLDTLHELDTVTVTLELTDEAGDPVTGPLITYESTAPEILSVAPTPDGARVAALAEGVARIVAYVADERFDVDTLEHTVVVEPLDIEWPRTINVTLRDTARVHLSERYAGGPFEWTSSNENVLLVLPVDSAPAVLDTVAEVLALGTGVANVAVVVGAANLVARQFELAVRVNERWISVDAGYEHTCALTVTGTAHCWGGNSFGELGDGSFTPRLRPTAVATPLKLDEVGAGGVASGLRAPVAHTCGRLGSQIFCWGSFEADQLGDDSGPCRDVFNPAACLKPLPVQSSISGSTLAVGGTHACTVRSGDPPGAVCWGGRDESSTAIRIGSGGGFSLIQEAGGEHACFTAFGGFGQGTQCAGRNDAGQLGDGTTIDQLTGGLGGFVTRPGGGPLEYNDGVAGGGKHSCTVDRFFGARQLYCWGWNSDGQLGPDGPGPATSPCPAGACSRLPVAIPVPADIAENGLTLGWAHSCFLSTAGTAYCWGRNVEGQLGDGMSTSRATPQPAASGFQFISLSAGDTHTCGVEPTGSMWCWGNNVSGQLGDGTHDSSPVPVRVLEP